jgi:ABC-type dipeptide/oligopeptide/nickel transport system permease subunit
MNQPATKPASIPTIQSGPHRPSLIRRWRQAVHQHTVLRGLLRQRSLWVGLLMLSVLAAATVIWPAVSQSDPFNQDLLGRLRPPAWTPEGSVAHPLGSDALGRDYLSRLLLGAQTTFRVCGLAALLSACFGSVLGLYAGYAGGHTETLLMRLADVQLAFPFIILCIALLSVVSPSLWTISLVLAVADWVIYTRLTRGRTLVEKEQEYMTAARAIGVRPPRIIFRHILPNVLPMIIVVAALEFGTLVQVEAILSFLGLGVQPPTPSWGNMLGEGRNYLSSQFYLMLLPGLFLFYTVLGTNLIADGLRNVLDPVSQR